MGSGLWVIFRLIPSAEVPARLDIELQCFFSVAAASAITWFPMIDRLIPISLLRHEVAGDYVCVRRSQEQTPSLGVSRHRVQALPEEFLARESSGAFRDRRIRLHRRGIERSNVLALPNEAHRSAAELTRDLRRGSAR